MTCCCWTQAWYHRYLTRMHATTRCSLPSNQSATARDAKPPLHQPNMPNSTLLSSPANWLLNTSQAPLHATRNTFAAARCRLLLQQEYNYHNPECQGLLQQPSKRSMLGQTDIADCMALCCLKKWTNLARTCPSTLTAVHQPAGLATRAIPVQVHPRHSGHAMVTTEARPLSEAPCQ